MPADGFRSVFKSFHSADTIATGFR